MVSFNMGENTSWKIIGGCDTANDVLSISCNYIDAATNKIDVIITIESLCSAHNAWVDKGDLYIGLARYDKWHHKRWYGHHKNKPEFDRNSGNTKFQPGYTITDIWKRKVLTSTYGLSFTPRFYRVMRGKNKYVFHLSGAKYLNDIFDLCNSAYYSMLEHGTYSKNYENGTETPVYIKLYGALIHYRKASSCEFEYDINNELGEYKNLDVTLFKANTRINDIQNDSTLGTNETKTRWIHNIFTEPVVYSDPMKVFFNNLEP